MVKKRIFYLDVIKVLAMLLVVFNHSQFLILNNNKITFIIHYLLLFISKTAVPLFFMVSGALLIGKNDSYRKIVKRIVRLTFSLIIVSTIWIFLNKKVNINNEWFPYWLWFLLAMIAIYLFLPFINKMITKFNKNDEKIFSIIFLLLPSIYYTINIFYNIIGNNENVFSNDLINNLITIPVAYFVLGYFIFKQKIAKKTKNISIILFFISLILEISSIYYFYINDLNYYKMDNYKIIFTTLMSPTLFIVIKYYFENYKKNNNFSSLITNLSSNSFLIYLFHVFVIEILCRTFFFKELKLFNSLECSLVIVFITIFLLDIIITIAKHIPIVKKVLNSIFS